VLSAERYDQHIKSWRGQSRFSLFSQSQEDNLLIQLLEYDILHMKTVRHSRRQVAQSGIPAPEWRINNLIEVTFLL
jgi:hypothetical protein